MVVGHAVVGVGRELHADALVADRPREVRELHILQLAALVLPERQDKLACRCAVQLLQRPIGVVDRFRGTRALLLMNRVVIQRARALPPALQDQFGGQRAQIIVAVALQRLLCESVHMLVLFAFVLELPGGSRSFLALQHAINARKTWQM